MLTLKYCLSGATSWTWSLEGLWFMAGKCCTIEPTSTVLLECCAYLSNRDLPLPPPSPGQSCRGAEALIWGQVLPKTHVRSKLKPHSSENLGFKVAPGGGAGSLTVLYSCEPCLASSVPLPCEDTAGPELNKHLGRREDRTGCGAWLGKSGPSLWCLLDDTPCTPTQGFPVGLGYYQFPLLLPSTKAALLETQTSQLSPHLS